MGEIQERIYKIERNVRVYEAAFKKVCQEFFNTAGGGFENVESMETCYLKEAEEKDKRFD